VVLRPRVNDSLVASGNNVVLRPRVNHLLHGLFAFHAVLVSTNHKAEVNKQIRTLTEGRAGKVARIARSFVPNSGKQSSLLRSALRRNPT
jgi:hypothetical protein